MLYISHVFLYVISAFSDPGRSEKPWHRTTIPNPSTWVAQSRPLMAGGSWPSGRRPVSRGEEKKRKRIFHDTTHSHLAPPPVPIPFPPPKQFALVWGPMGTLAMMNFASCLVTKRSFFSSRIGSVMKERRNCIFCFLQSIRYKVGGTFFCFQLFFTFVQLRTRRTLSIASGEGEEGEGEGEGICFILRKSNDCSHTSRFPSTPARRDLL
jgi:hypothetical protein